MRIAPNSPSTDSASERGSKPLQLWPPVLALRGPGTRSARHAHHAMHVVVALEGELKVTSAKGTAHAAGVVTTPNVPHAIDSEGAEVLLVFLDPESDAGTALREAMISEVRLLGAGERTKLRALGLEPARFVGEGGVEWARGAAAILGGVQLPRRKVDPRVRRVVRRLRESAPGDDLSLEALAASVDLSPGRLMHVFTESIGIPLRPYLAWLRLQRAAATMASGAPLTRAAHDAGFSDAAHFSRTFRRTFGAPPSMLRPRRS